METSNESPKSIWRKSRKGWRAVLFLFAVLVPSIFAIIFVVGSFSGMKGNDTKFLAKLAVAAIVLAIFITMAVAVIWWVIRNFRKALFGLACLATLIALFYVVENVHGKWAWHRFQREWEAKGAKFDVASFAPPPVPDNRNFAMTPVVASTYDWLIDKAGHEIKPRPTNATPGLQFNINHGTDWNTPTNGEWAMGTVTDLSPWQTYFRTVQTNGTGTLTNEFPTTPQPQTPAEDVLLALSKYDSTLEQLRDASRMPESRFPLEYDKDNPSMMLLPHLAALNRTTQFLELRAIAELQAGEIEKAAADVNLMLYLIQSVHTEPIMISHLVRIRMLNSALQPIYEGLVAHKWTDAQLAGFDSKLAEMNFASDYKLATRGHVAFIAGTLDYLQRTRKISDFSWSNGEHVGHWFDRLLFITPRGWFHQNQIRFARLLLEQSLPVVNPENGQFSPKLADEAQASIDATLAHPGPYTFVEAAILGPVKKWAFEKHVSADRFAFAQTSVNLARVAIALERYRMAHGKYPEALGALAPQFIDAVPNDVIGGGPLKYGFTNDGFVLYSIGWNEKDDGGTPVPMKTGFPDSDDGDWVWRSPAKN